MVWAICFICSLFTPLVIVFAGWVMRTNCIKRNNFCGYRTKMAMKNDDTWKFANEICGKIWWKTGWILFFLTILIFLIIIKAGNNASTFVTTILMTIECLIIVFTIIFVEKSLKKTFDKDGNRKS